MLKSVVFFLFDADEAHDDGAEKKIEQDLKEGISSDESEDHISSDAVKSEHRRPFSQRLHEEEEASDKEQTCVDDRAHQSRCKAGEPYVDPLESLVGETGEEAGCRALSEDGENGAEYIDYEEGGGVS